MYKRQPDIPGKGTVRYEKKPVKDQKGQVVPDLCTVWITLDNPSQLNSYETEMVKQVILGFRRASNERDAVAVVFTGAGTRSFCTGGNTKEYAEYYSGRPEEYRQYMRLFNDMVSGILSCDRPVICRSHGLPLMMEGRRDTCPLNFKDLPIAALPEQDVLSVEALTTVLVAVNKLYCEEQGGDTLRRRAVGGLVGRGPRGDG